MQMQSELLQNRRHFASDAIAALRDAARRIDDPEMLDVLALRLELCNHADNHFFATKRSSYHNGNYTYHGQFWRCHSKLCPHCQAYHGRRNRQRLWQALVVQTPDRAHQYRFVTLTIVNPGLSIIDTRRLVYRAWVLFRKTDFWRSLLVGGCKSEEFTVTASGIHYHLHVLMLSPYFNYQSLREEWTRAYEQACSELLDEVPEIGTTDGLLICKVQFVKSIDRVLFEMCKYVTKSVSFRSLSDDDLADLATVQRWSRMFELLGTFRSAELIVHNRLVSDGEEVQSVDDETVPVTKTWREDVLTFGVDVTIASITRQWERAIDFGMRKLEKDADIVAVTYGFPSDES